MSKSRATAVNQITATLPYLGCKRTFAPVIVEEIGEHSAYWDLCCGSLAPLFAKPLCPMETVNDLYGEVTNLARVLACEPTAAELYQRTRRVLMSEVLFRESAAVLKGAPCEEVVSVDRAYHLLVASWLGRNGVTGTASYNHGLCVRFTSNGGHAAKRWRSVVESIPDWHERLRNVTILTRDLFEIIPRIEDKKGTVIYIDPPYVEKNAKYVHDFASQDSVLPPEVWAILKHEAKRVYPHQYLHELLSRFRKTRVIVSYYDHPLVNALYTGWTKRSVEVTKHLANHSNGVVKAQEVLFINGPSFTQASHGSLF